jgi:hypothetical protein
VARPPAVALLCATVLAIIPAQAQAGWSRPFRIAGPTSLDVLPAQLAVSSSARFAVGFGFQNEDNTANSSAFATLRQLPGRSGGAGRVPDAQQVLGLAFSANGLELLTAGSPRGKACCSTAHITSFDGRVFGRPRTVLRNLTGDAAGRLLALPGRRLLAAIATDRGVWVTQSSRGERFGPARRLSSSGARPWSLAAANLRGARTMVAWAAPSGAPSTSEIFTASGSPQRAPRSGLDIQLTPGHQVDELGLVPSAAGGTAAWVESWYDPAGAYHSLLAASDVSRRAHVRSFPVVGQAAAGLALAADARGDQLLAYKSCDAAGSCTLWALSRRARGTLGAPQRLGTIDASQSPAVAVGPGGQGVIGWVRNGHVLAVSHRAAGARFGGPRTVSSASDDADLTIAFASNRQAIGVWTQGTVAPSVMAALFRG